MTTLMIIELVAQVIWMAILSYVPSDDDAETKATRRIRSILFTIGLLIIFRTATAFDKEYTRLEQIEAKQDSLNIKMERILK